jgi:hypothetical protein
MTRRTLPFAVLAAAVVLSIAFAGVAAAAPLRDSNGDLGVVVVPFKAGDTPADFGQRVPAPVLGGDTPADFGVVTPTAPTHLQIVRPERTVVQDVDEALPIVLASLALVLASVGLGVALSRSGAHVRVGRSH